MRIKRHDYPIDQVKIDISDSRHFADIAYLVDNPTVLQDISIIRNKWLRGKVIPHDEVIDFLNLNRNVKETAEHWKNLQECVKLAPPGRQS